MLYLVGLFIERTEKGTVWHLAGVYETEGAAVASCGKNGNMFVAECGVNHFVGSLEEGYPGGYNVWYPAVETKSEARKRLGRATPPGASGDRMSNQKEFTSKHVFVDQAGRVHFQSDKFPQLPPDWVALSLDNMEDRKALAERFGATDNQFTQDLKEVLYDKEK